MTTLEFTFGCIVCLTAIFIAVGICSTIEKVHGKGK